MLHLATQTVDLEQQINQLGLRTVLIASLILIGCTIIATLLKDHYPKLKLPLFLTMAGTLVVSTLLLLGSTVYLNTKAESNGPVHWHADIEFWACGTELELRNPVGALSNKIGTATYHEHNDKRIHLEGVVVKKAEDASLGKFMRVIGGEISDSALIVPLDKDQDRWFADKPERIDGDAHHPENHSLALGGGQWVKEVKDGSVVTYLNGRQCSGGDEAPAEVQVFVYSYDDSAKTYSQRKLERPAEYIMRDESVVPPGDCVIVEYDVPKDRTNKLCRQYGLRDEKRCVEFGVKEFSPDLCNAREVIVQNSTTTNPPALETNNPSPQSTPNSQQLEESDPNCQNGSPSIEVCPGGNR